MLGKSIHCVEVVMIGMRKENLKGSFWKEKIKFESQRVTFWKRKRNFMKARSGRCEREVKPWKHEIKCNWKNKNEKIKWNLPQFEKTANHFVWFVKKSLTLTSGLRNLQCICVLEVFVTFVNKFQLKLRIFVVNRPAPRQLSEDDTVQQY